MDSYAAKKDRIAAQMAASASTVSLRKDTSNLFRHRAGAGEARIDVRDFDRVLSDVQSSLHVEECAG